MPRDQVSFMDQLKSRQPIIRQQSNEHLRIVAHPTRDFPGCLIRLDIFSSSFLFGRFSEGTQRVSIENTSRGSRVRDVFVTGQTSYTQQFGGLPGWILTSIEQGNHNVNIFGDRNIQWSVATLRRFVFKQKARMSVVHPVRDIVNELMTVVPVELNTTKVVRTSGEYQSDERSSAVISKMFASLTGEGSRVDSFDKPLKLPDPQFKERSMSYLIQLHPVRGKFNAKLADSLQVPVGPIRGKLVKGETWTRPDGYVVKPEMLISPPLIPGRILILDLPTNDLFTAATEKNWHAYVPVPDEQMRGVKTNLDIFEDSIEPVDFRIVIHILGKEIDPLSLEYKKFMHSFGPDCEHMICHPDFVTDHGSYFRQAQLNAALRQISKSNFPIPTGSDNTRTIPDEYNRYLRPTKSQEQLALSMIPMMTGMQYVIVGRDITNNFASLLARKTTFEGELARMDALARSKLPALAVQAETAIKELRYQESHRQQRRLRQRQLIEQEQEAILIDEPETKNPELDTPLIKNTETNKKRKHDEIAQLVWHRDESSQEVDRILTAHEDLFGKVNVITLGTGSAAPGILRNVSGTLVELPFYNEVRSVLLDCGESTVWNLLRLYGYEECAEKLRQLKLIYISHNHADHLLGIVSLLEQRRRAWDGVCQDPVDSNAKDNVDRHLYIIIPRLVLQLLVEWKQIYPDYFRDVTFLLAQTSLPFLRDGNPGLTSDQIQKAQELEDQLRVELLESVDICREKQKLCELLDLSSIDIIGAVHLAAPTSIALEFRNGFKLSFSGDTRPNEAFAWIARNSTLLIHESTLGDSLIADAKAKRHSTMTEAKIMAYVTNSKYVLLTHFSQRYPVLAITGKEKIETKFTKMLAINEDRFGQFLKDAAADSLQPVQQTSQTNMTLVTPQAIPEARLWDDTVQIAVGIDGMSLSLRDFVLQRAWSKSMSAVYGQFIEAELAPIEEVLSLDADQEEMLIS
ncbi:uncharacterized protein V1516DRAFT_679823 [Lipomyces oligophaga]|uniref:uncharacterized protein n=1 Tax=Lipomyces oligophaga TaxID=45792 RepID=UPI0034CF9DBA